MKNQKGYINIAGGLFIALVIVLVIGAIVFLPLYYVKGTERQVNFKLTKTERITDQNGQGAKYLLFTDQGTFQNTDSLLNGKFNSSDLYGSLQSGKNYSCKVYGWRMPFFSSYPNVVNCKEV